MPRSASSYEGGAIWNMISALVSKEPTDGDRRLIASVASLELASVTRVLPRTAPNTVTYGCPVCLYATTEWDVFNEHRTKWQHGIAICTVCGGIGKHADRNCIGGFTGFFWDKQDFIVPQAEFAPPTIQQYHCAPCRLTFDSKHAMQMHAARLSENRTTIRPLHSLPRRYFTRGDDDMSAPPRPLGGSSGVLKSEQKKVGRLLYQCPDCLYLFSSWSQWEAHVRTTKHSQPYCLECGKMLGKFVTDDGDHAIQTSHTRIVGSQPSKETHLRLVDTSQARLTDVVDHARASLVDPENWAIPAFQCPADTCGYIFLTRDELVKHCDVHQHHRISCDHCGEVLDALTDSIVNHPHAIPNLPLSFWPLRFQGETCQVEVLEADLAAWFPSLYVRCKKCRSVVPLDQEEAHTDSDICVAAHGRRAAQQDQVDRAKSRQKDSQASSTHQRSPYSTPPNSSDQRTTHSSNNGYSNLTPSGWSHHAPTSYDAQSLAFAANAGQAQMYPHGAVPMVVPTMAAPNSGMPVFMAPQPTSMMHPGVGGGQFVVGP